MGHVFADQHDAHSPRPRWLDSEFVYVLGPQWEEGSRCGWEMMGTRIWMAMMLIDSLDPALILFIDFFAGTGSTCGNARSRSPNLRQFYVDCFFWWVLRAMSLVSPVCTMWTPDQLTKIYIYIYVCANTLLYRKARCLCSKWSTHGGVPSLR